MTGYVSHPDQAGAPLLRRMAGNIEHAFALLLRAPRVAASRPLPWPRDAIVIAFVAAGIALALIVAVLDGPAIRAVRQLPHWIVWPFDQITGFGKSGWFLWPLGILFLVIAAIPPLLPPMLQRVLAALTVRVGFLFTAIAVPGLAITVLKHVIGRARPFVSGTADPYLFHPFTWQAAYASVPSGHTTTAFSALVAIGSLWPQTRSVMWTYAILISISRVMVLAHHPSDVVAGALAGAAGALVVRHYFAERRLGFVIAADGGVRRLPGPSWRRIKAVARALLS